MTNLNLKPQAEFEVTTSPSGTWQVQLPKDLPAGFHRVVVTAPDGQEQDLALFNVEKTTNVSFVNHIQPIIPHYYFYPILFFLVIISLLSLNIVRLMIKKRRRQAQRVIFKQQAYLMLFVVLGMTSSLLVGLFLMYKITLQSDSFKQNNKNLIVRQNKTPIVKINKYQGFFLNPLTGATIKDVKLIAKNVSIVLGESGQFVFSNLRSDDLIKVEDAKLKRLVYFKPLNKVGVAVFYDSNLYNTLLKISDLSKQKKTSQIYDFLSFELSKKIDRVSFVEKYSSIFDPLLNEKLIFEKVGLKDNFVSKLGLNYSKVVEFVLVDNAGKHVYNFVFENGKWVLVF